MVLAAGGEFAFVVFKIGRDQGLFEPHLYDVLVLTITLSMALTPLLLLVCPKLFSPRSTVEVPEEYRTIDTDAPRVVIAGMGRMGQIVARILRAQNISFIALDTSVETIELTRSFGGVPVFYGDPMRPEILTRPRSAGGVLRDCHGRPGDQHQDRRAGAQALPAHEDHRPRA
jgi:glutathione-regulated potassium-efflux system protein KefB